MIGIDARLVLKENVLPGEAEHGDVAREARQAPAIDQNISVRVGSADAGHRTVGGKFIPFREIFLGSAGKAKQGKARIHGIEESSDGDVENGVAAPYGIVVEDLDAVVIGRGPIRPAVTQS